MERRNQITFSSKDNEELFKLLHVMEAKRNDVDNQSINKNLTSNDTNIARSKVDPSLDDVKRQELWGLLEHFQGIFAWNKGKLGCYTIGKHVVDTPRFPPCKYSFGRLSY